MMYGWDVNGWDWAWMSLMMFIGTALVIYVVAMLARGAWGGGPPRQSENPLDILAQRFARGEIDEAEYQRRRNVLLGQP